MRTYVQLRRFCVPHVKLKQPIDRPWIFDSDVCDISQYTGMSAGTWVWVPEHERMGVMNRQASITVRMLPWEAKEPCDAKGLRRRLQEMIRPRLEGLPDDFQGRIDFPGFPGAVVYRFGQGAVVKYETLGAYAAFDRYISDCLRPLQVSTLRMISKKEKLAQGGEEWAVTTSSGDGTFTARDCGNDIQFNLKQNFRVFDFEMEEIRKTVGRLAAGGTVANLWSHLGQWGLACQRAGSTETIYVDDKLSFATQAEKNVIANGFELSSTVLHRMDIYDELKSMILSNIKFQTVIINLRQPMDYYYKQKHGMFGRWFKPSFKKVENVVKLASYITARRGILVVNFPEGMPFDKRSWATNFVRCGLDEASRQGTILMDIGVFGKEGIPDGLIEDFWYPRVVVARLN
eukprot:GEMP01038662.1.p1 GENE.GEMP01038662.1~~GEMP01038662.1.p1  ORF type:complete len:402 (+),score=62.41 GEMP01038662.1:46-1251(+)